LKKSIFKVKSFKVKFIKIIVFLNEIDFSLHNMIP